MKILTKKGDNYYTPLSKKDYENTLHTLMRDLTDNVISKIGNTSKDFKKIDKKNIDLIYENVTRGYSYEDSYYVSRDTIEFVKKLDEKDVKDFLLEFGEFNISIDVTRENVEEEFGCVGSDAIPEDLNFDDINSLQVFVDEIVESEELYLECNHMEKGTANPSLTVKIDLYPVYPNRIEGMVFNVRPNLEVA